MHTAKAKSGLYLLAFVAASAIGLTNSVESALAYNRVCMWPMTADVPVYINPTNFELRGIDRNHVRRQLALAMNEWYTRGAMPYRFYFSDYTTRTTEDSSSLLVVAEDVNAANPDWTAAAGYCAPGKITVYTRHFIFSAGANQAGQTQWPVQDMYHNFLHEFGHVLGFGHPANGEFAKMDYNNQVREITPDDIEGLRNGTCSSGTSCGGCTNGTQCGYGIRQSTLVGLRSTNDGTTWSENNSGFVNPGGVTTIEAGHAFGETDSNAKYVIAYSNGSSTNTNRIFAMKGSGASWSTPAAISTSSANATTLSGPAVAWGTDSSGNGRWLVVWASGQDSSTAYGKLYYVTSTDGSTWGSIGQVQFVSGSTTISPLSLSRPSLTYAPRAHKFVLTYVDRDTNRMYAMVGTPAATITWDTWDEQGPSSIHGVSVDCTWGPGLSSATYDDCVAAWPWHKQSEFISSSIGWTDSDWFWGFKTSDPWVSTTAYTQDPLSVAVKGDTTNGGVAATMMLVRGSVLPTYVYVASKTTSSQLTAWPSFTALSQFSAVVTGPSLEYSPHWEEWTGVYAR